MILYSQLFFALPTSAVLRLLCYNHSGTFFKVMAFIAHRILVSEETYPRLQELIADMPRMPQVTHHGWGHDSRGRTYMVYARADISEQIKAKGLSVTAKQLLPY